MKEKMPLSIKLNKELHERLIEVSDRLGIAKHRLAEMAIEAATEAIERNGYRLVVPIEFDVTHEATKKTSSSSTYPPDRGERIIAEDKPSSAKKEAEQFLKEVPLGPTPRSPSSRKK